MIGVDPSMTLTYRAEYTKYVTQEELPTVQLMQEWLIQHRDKLEAYKNTREKTQAFTLLPHCTESTNASSSVKQWQQVFEALGLQLASQAVGCCGMAGTYGHETRNVDTSLKIYDQSWRNAVESAEDSSNLLATGYSCRCQVKRFSETLIQHPIQALLKAITLD